MCRYQCVEFCSADPKCIVECGGIHPKAYPDKCPIADSDSEHIAWVKVPQTSEAKVENPNSAELLKFCKQEMKVADDVLLHPNPDKYHIKHQNWMHGYKRAFENIIEGFSLDKVPAIPCPNGEHNRAKEGN